MFSEKRFTQNLFCVVSTASEGWDCSLHPWQCQGLGLLLPDKPQTDGHTAADYQSCRTGAEQESEGWAAAIRGRPIATSQGGIFVFFSSFWTLKNRSFWFLEMIVMYLFFVCLYVCTCLYSMHVPIIPTCVLLQATSLSNHSLYCYHLTLLYTSSNVDIANP